MNEIEGGERTGAADEAERADAIREIKKRRDFGAHAVTYMRRPITAADVQRQIERKRR